MTILPIHVEIQITTLKFHKRSLTVQTLNFISEKQICHRPLGRRISMSPNFCLRVGPTKRTVRFFFYSTYNNRDEH